MAVRCIEKEEKKKIKEKERSVERESKGARKPLLGFYFRRFFLTFISVATARAPSASRLFVSAKRERLAAALLCGFSFSCASPQCTLRHFFCE